MRAGKIGPPPALLPDHFVCGRRLFQNQDGANERVARNTDESVRMVTLSPPLVRHGVATAQASAHGPTRPAHRASCALQPRARARLESLEIFEVVEHRQHHLSTDRRHHELRHNQPEVLHRPCAAGAAITHKAGCLVVPFPIEIVEAFFSAPEMP